MHRGFHGFPSQTAVGFVDYVVHHTPPGTTGSTGEHSTLHVLSIVAEGGRFHTSAAQPPILLRHYRSYTFRGLSESPIRSLTPTMHIQLSLRTRRHRGSQLRRAVPATYSRAFKRYSYGDTLTNAHMVIAEILSICVVHNLQWCFYPGTLLPRPSREAIETIQSPTSILYTG
ncbi:hypothetical protein BV22DRAFT_287107 [Leucogyrophana mollusca]|uniref:Uncharacterized protein n=1 Tax=Leucogyrophana mollusca TaxID=85980 RepID=A0ACB8BRU0_9AGAM|nr:hypothetical protein BV22DRAFT_287107 [Leucogyrophana mollusca]